MSRTATDWAWSLTIKPATSKLILLSMADRADEEHCCFPSIDRLARDTSLDKKTVKSGVARLAEMGVIKDTGERKGKTQRVRVFRLNISENGPVKTTQKRNDSKNGNEPENGSLNEPENGSLNEPENGTQNQSCEPPIETSSDGTTKWLPQNTWKEFIEHRKQLKAPMTEKARSMTINKLANLRREGYSPAEVLEQSIINGWKGVFEVKGDKRKGGQGQPVDAYANAGDCSGSIYIPPPAPDTGSWKRGQ